MEREREEIAERLLSNEKYIKQRVTFVSYYNRNRFHKRINKLSTKNNVEFLFSDIFIILFVFLFAILNKYGSRR